MLLVPSYYFIMAKHGTFLATPQDHRHFPNILRICVGRTVLHTNCTSLNIRMLNALLRTTHIHTHTATQCTPALVAAFDCFCLSESLCPLLHSYSSSLSPAPPASADTPVHHLITALSLLQLLMFSLEYIPLLSLANTKTKQHSTDHSLHSLL